MVSERRSEVAAVDACLRKSEMKTAAETAVRAAPRRNRARARCGRPSSRGEASAGACGQAEREQLERLARARAVGIRARLRVGDAFQGGLGGLIRGSGGEPASRVIPMSCGLARARRPRGFSAFLALVAGLSGQACKGHGANPTPAAGAKRTAVRSDLDGKLHRQRRVDVRDRFEIIPNLSWCEVEHEGLLLDLGSPAAAPYRGFGAEQADDSEDVERDGQTFVRAYGRALRYDFWLDEPRSGTSVSLRVYGGAAKWLAVAIDDKRVGSVKASTGRDRR